ncbi:MAG TPA: class I SAM-dependent methyltransferase [Urbifossiella sp.]|nr:class I SAM-dependent methyltransferase [Urbifossiella sp.]
MSTNSYDEIPYDSHPYAQTHPSRMAVVATLFGLQPPAVESCRVLELGSAAGGNIIPIAESFPNSQWIGIDLSERQIADGHKMLAATGVKNVQLRHASILEVDESYGQFDYIIAHGVFSWVPSEVRDKILAICAERLNPNGVAYISYNTYPGWHMRGMIRDMMKYHSNNFPEPRQRVQQARALLDFLAASARQEGPYSALLKSELESIRNQSDNYLYHEHLEQVNEPLYFHQFIGMAERHGLRYLGEARLPTMVTGNFGPEVQKTLKTLAPNQIQTEQYMDFLRNRMFRETLLVKPAPNWTIEPLCLRKLHVWSCGRPAGKTEPNIHSEETEQYQTRSGMSLSTNRPLLKAAMKALGERWPGTIAFDDLRRAARALLGGNPDDAAGAEDDAKVLALGLVNTYISSDLIELSAIPIPVARKAGEKPRATASARERVALGAAWAANRRHELVKLSDLDLRLLPLLDGQRDRPAILDALVEKAIAGDLTVQKNGNRLTERDAIRAGLTAILDQALDNLAVQAVLAE